MAARGLLISSTILSAMSRKRELSIAAGEKLSFRILTCRRRGARPRVVFDLHLRARALAKLILLRRSLALCQLSTDRPQSSISYSACVDCRSCRTPLRRDLLRPRPATERLVGLCGQRQMAYDRYTSSGRRCLPSRGSPPRPVSLQGSQHPPSVASRRGRH
jgi:hypothetical protein